MSKARKTAAAATRESAAPAPLDLARRHAAAGRWREAITAFKDLLKGAGTGGAAPGLRLELAAAYAGRARELAAKAMYKEALTVWENRDRLAPELPPEPDHFALILRQGQVPAALAMLARSGGSLDPAVLASLRSHLAARHLGGDPAVAAGLAADDPILTQGEPAARALDAWCRGDDAQLRAALAAIPFRSPYRDLAQVLKALEQLREAPEAAATLLARVGDDSGFAPLRRACVLALTPAEQLTGRLTGCGEATRGFALTLAGWGAARQALWEDARAATALDTGPKPLLRLLHRHRERLGEEWARRQSLRLLVAGYPKSAGLIAEAGARRLSEDERLLVAAWRAEQVQDPDAEVQAWDAYAHHLMAAGPLPAGTDAALQVALVLRRTDSLRDLLGQVKPSVSSLAVDRRLARALALSLDYDPHDHDTWERLIRYHLRGDDLKAARPLLAHALARFPKDPGLLTAALDLALAGNAFKKAARYAREILAVDPINTGARERLVKAHLAHARKQVRTARLDLARRELAEAAEWDQDGRHSERRRLLAGLLDLIEDGGKAAAALGTQAAALGGGLTAALILGLEATAIGRTAAWALKAVGLARPKVADQADLTGFLARLRALLEADEGLAPELRKLLEKPLTAAATRPLTAAEAQTACDTLRRARFDQARRAFAEAALRRWPGTPVFVMHQFESRSATARRNPSGPDLDRLEHAMNRAREAGDERTAHRIAQLMAESDSAPWLLGPPPGFLADGFDPEMEPGPLDAMSDPETVLRIFIEAAGIDQVLKITGLGAAERATFKKIERELGREQAIDRLVELLCEDLRNFDANLLPRGLGR